MQKNVKHRLKQLRSKIEDLNVKAERLEKIETFKKLMKDGKVFICEYNPSLNTYEKLYSVNEIMELSTGRNIFRQLTRGLLVQQKDLENEISTQSIVDEKHIKKSGKPIKG